MLRGVARRLTAADRAREPRSLAVVAWFDGWGQALGMPPKPYPRHLSPAEGRAWREGFQQGRQDRPR